MKAIQQLQKACYKSKVYLKRASPTILTCVGAVGVVATAVLAVKATPKAIQILKEAGDEKGEELTALETVQIAAPLYIPSALIGLSTIFCIFGANALNKKQQASLVSAYAMLSESYKKYRGAANTVFGEDADAKIIAEMAKETYISANGIAVYDPENDSESDKVLFYDFYSQRYFTSTFASVLNAEYHVNRNLTLRGEVSVNEFYDFLGIEGIDDWWDVGWSMDNLMESGYMWLDFENRYTEIEDGMECYIISSSTYPEMLYGTN